ncbi:MAG TPA: AarF/ABC1/UbiB kinase family protein [Candidatus Brocadiia bacterium]|nr:AarF/ABC1/UbiB kinase family protein [Candidatus Brocadiia bacterium]
MVDFSSIAKVPKRAMRMAHIARIMVKHGLGGIAEQMGLHRHLPTGARLQPHIPSEEPAESIPERIANAIEELGPTFVKFAQMLSTRPDLLPPEYIQSLKRVFHHVKPFPADQARRTIEEELGRGISELFQDFTNEPIASGSIAQVHLATLLDGHKVVIKVRRPDIERIIEDDMSLLLYLASQVERVENLRALHLSLIAEEFSHGIRRELDLVTEAANTNRFHEALAGNSDVIVPKVFWEYTTSKVLTLERLEGEDLAGVSDLEARGIDPKKLARTLVDLFLIQFLDLGIFHADPHPGNIRILPGGKLALIDFGLVGHVTNELQNHLCSALIAVSTGNVELVVEILAELGIIQDDTDLRALRSALTEILDKYYSIPLREINLQDAVTELMGVIREHKVQFPRDFVLMGKVTGMIGGEVLELDPEIDIAEALTPYAKKMWLRRFSPARMSHSLHSNAWTLGTILGRGPRDLRDLIRRLLRGKLQFTIQHQGLDELARELDRSSNRLAMSIMLAAIVIGSSIVLATKVGYLIPGTDVSALGISGFLVALIAGFWLVWKIFRSGGL